MEIKYKSTNINKGDFLSPLQSVSKPIIKYNANKNKLYTIILHDPDAVIGNRVHWLVINIPGSAIQNGDTVFDYDGPHPPPKSGIHKYIFMIYEQPGKIMNNFINDNKERIITIPSLLEKLGLKRSPIYSNYFISSYSGGNKTHKKLSKKIYKKQKKTRKYIIYKL
jgi:phosphatidylethanolamine-binding protein (PEBP) family uncharacterized protein